MGNTIAIVGILVMGAAFLTFFIVRLIETNKEIKEIQQQEKK